MQGARSRSPVRGLIEGTAFSIQAPLVGQNFSGNVVQRGDQTKKQNSSLTASGMGSSQNYAFNMTSQNVGQTHSNMVDGYSAYNLAMGGTTTTSSHHSQSQVTVLKRDAQEAGLMNPSADESSDSDDEPSVKPALKPGKKTKGRVKIKMEFIQNKLRRYTTFSKRKTGIMKKAYELSTLTGTQVMLLVASETGHVYTFATRKLQPMITSDSGKALIQTCLNSPDVSGGQNDQRMNPTGYEETELNYAVSEEEMRNMEPGMELMRNPSPPSDNDDVMRRPAHIMQSHSRPRSETFRLSAPKEKRHLLHPRPRPHQSSQQRPQVIAPSTSSISSNGATLPLQVSSALQLGMEGVQTDALGQQYLTIPLPVTLSNHQQLIQPLLTGQHPSLRLTGHTTTLSGQSNSSMAGLVALDKRHDRNGK